MKMTNKHGRVGVKNRARYERRVGLKRREQASSRNTAVFREAWKDGYKTGMKEGSEFMVTLLKERKATEIHRRIKSKLGMI